MPSNDGAQARNASSSTSHTEGTSSNDSSFFGSRNRLKAAPVHQDIDEAAEKSAGASSSATSRLSSTDPQRDATRSASAMGMLDFKPDPSDNDNGSAATDPKSVKVRPERPSSQSNLLDAFANGSSRYSSSTASQQTRGGRLGRLAYKKDDSIAFIAQSRNASQRMAAEGRNGNLEDTERHQQWGATSPSSAFVAARGLGIEDMGGPYIVERTSDRSELGANVRAYAHPPGYGSTLDDKGNLDRADAVQVESGVGVASLPAHGESIATSSNTSSRAPSVAGTYIGAYHNRFSRQGYSQQTAQETSQEAEPRATRASMEGLPQVSASSRASDVKSTTSPRGTLSDAAIAAMGAMPGASAGSLLNANGAPLSSKNILTIALQKAQSAVQLDSANNVPEAISAYKQAVRLLEEVMERIAPRNGKRSRPSREEERRRLRVIHDTYADRIRLLSMIYSPDVDANEETSDTSFSSSAHPTSTKADWLDRVRDDSQDEPATAVTPRVNGDMLDPSMQYSPREDARSFLSITPVGTAFPSSPAQPSTQLKSQQPQQQHPWPRSPPLPNTPLSPSLETSPRRRVRDHVRPGSRGSRGSRASISLSIADEQDVQAYRNQPPAIAEEMPRISVEATTPEAVYTHAVSSNKEPVRDATRQVREAEVVMQQHGRSDSDSSYQSTATGSRLKPAAPQHRSYGLDDEVRTPVTPYFDASGDVGLPDERASSVISTAEPLGRQQKSSLTSLSRPRIESTGSSVEKPAKMGLAQRARALSFKGPQLRQKASMPSLGDRKKGDVVAINGFTTPKGKTHRPGSADAPSAESHSLQRTDVGNDHPTPWDLEASSSATARPGSNRPRASTASALVSSTTSAGTISQRRKVSNAAHNPDAQARQGLAGELEELRMLEDASAAMSSRQRSTSQPGSRRPSIPAAFVSANASISGIALPSSLGGGGVSPNGEQRPPPVPNLARTLSALELKRSVDAKISAVDASYGAADVSTGSLAMPLPRPLSLDEKSHGDVAGDNTFLITDIFPSGLPSLAAGAPSYASTFPPMQSSSASSRSNPPHSLLKPFSIMSQLHHSITSPSASDGAQLTARLFLPHTLWRQPGGVKLVSVETKMRAMDALVVGLEAVQRGGEGLLMPLGSGAGLETVNGGRFVKCLDEWEGLMAEVQASLARKLPFIEAAVGEVKGAKSSFGSRLTRGLDRMTGSVGQAKAVDSALVGAYVDALARLFAKSSLLAAHLTAVLVADGSIPPQASAAMGPTGALQSPTGIGKAHANLTAYSALPAHLRATVLAKLSKSSEFFARIVLAFVLHDTGILVDRTTKKGSCLFVD